MPIGTYTLRGHTTITRFLHMDIERGCLGAFGAVARSSEVIAGALGSWESILPLRAPEGAQTCTKSTEYFPFFTATLFFH